MREEIFNGSVAGLRKSEFIGAEDDLDGYTKDAPLSLIIEKLVKCNGVIGDDGKTENGVVAFVFSGIERRLRLNAGRRKIMTKSHGATAANWAGANIRLYQTADIWAGKTVPAVGMDAQIPNGKWLDYIDFQTTRGRNAAEQYLATVRQNTPQIDIHQLKLGAETAAAGGIGSLTAWWKKMDKPSWTAMNPLWAEYEKKAEDADHE